MVATHTVPATLTVGVVTVVHYLWQDADYNIAQCAFNINVQGKMVGIKNKLKVIKQTGLEIKPVLISDTLKNK